MVEGKELRLKYISGVEMFTKPSDLDDRVISKDPPTPPPSSACVSRWIGRTIKIELLVLWWWGCPSDALNTFSTFDSGDVFKVVYLGCYRDEGEDVDWEVSVVVDIAISCSP